MRVDKLAETIGDADALAGGCSPAKRLADELLCFSFILHGVADATAPRSNAPVSDIDKPIAEQIRARFKTVRPESTEGGITSFEHGREGVHHGRIPVFGGVKKTTVFLTEFLIFRLFQIFLPFSVKKDGKRIKVCNPGSESHFLALGVNPTFEPPAAR